MGQVIEADEQGLLRVPVNMLGDVQPHGRYIVEVVGKKLVVEPEPTEELRRQAYEKWLKEWDALTDEITAAWNTEKSATEIISEMRH